MSKKSLANILIVDDGDDRTMVTLLQNEGLKANALHPQDVEVEDVKRADLVLVDFQLDKWPDRDAAPFSLRPRDGLALGALLRRHVHDIDRNSPTAFGIRTGHMDALASPLPPESRGHILAAINNLEWVFNKAEDAQSVGQIVSLGLALGLLPKKWPEPGSSEALSKALELLGLDDDKSPDEIDDVLRCLPPLHSMSSWSHGLAFVRWLLHRILPYPCFLLDANYLAARLRITTETLSEISSVTTDPLAACRYRGILEDFLGPRWWRSRIEQALWQNTKGDTLDGAKIREWLSGAAGIAAVAAATDDYPVVCRDISHRTLPTVFPMRDCVRIQPDDWPAYADQAWTTIELAKNNPSLATLVTAGDGMKLQTNGT
jgi:hypothetical protein